MPGSEHLQIGWSCGVFPIRSPYLPKATKSTPSWQRLSLMAVATFSLIIHPATLQKLLSNGLRNMTQRSNVDFHSEFPRSQSEPASVRWRTKSNPWSPPIASYSSWICCQLSQHRFCGVHALMGPSCLGTTRGTYTILGRGFSVVADQYTVIQYSIQECKQFKFPQKMDVTQ